MEACGINFFYLRAVFPLTLMLATASAQVCVPLGHSSLYFDTVSLKDEMPLFNRIFVLTSISIMTLVVLVLVLEKSSLYL